MHEIDLKAIEHDIQTRGWAHIKNVYSMDLVEEVRADLERMRPVYEQIQKDAGIYEETRNAYHYTIVSCPSQLKMLDPFPFHEFLEHYFRGRYILSSMGTTFVEPNVNVYTQNIHRDSRSYHPENPQLLNMLIMLDDSTEDNGATWLLEGSQNQADKPSEEFFYENAVRGIGEAGDVIFFDGNIWHSSGENTTDKVRRIITPMFSRPFFKQGLDLPRAFGYDFALQISDELKQILGYNALTPVTLQEFYKPREKRFYKADQG